MYVPKKHLLSRGQDKFGKTMTLLFTNAYKETRKKWIKIIAKDLEGIHTLLDLYFKILISAISIDGMIYFPDSLKRHNQTNSADAKSRAAD